MIIEKMSPFVVDNESVDPRFRAPINPFVQEHFLMGTVIGANVTILHERHGFQHQEFIDVVDGNTGERIRIRF